MADNLIPDDIRAFILRYIDSVAQLEALLLLRANPAEAWDATRIAQRLYIEDGEIAALLARLCEDGLLVTENALYRFDGVAKTQRDNIDRLAQIYARHLIPVTNIIHGKPRRVRQFADAFKFRKDR